MNVYTFTHAGRLWHYLAANFNLALQAFCEEHAVNPIWADLIDFWSL